MSYHTDQLKMMLGISGLVSFYGITSLAIWFLGPYVGFDNYIWQLVVIGLLLLTLPFVLLFAWLIRRRRRKREEAEAQASATPTDRPAKAASAPSRVYDELYRGAEEAVQWLRSTRLGNARAKDAVYGLPWFVFAGPAGGGKTSLALSSGFDPHALPSQRRSEANIVRPTRHCEWRMTGSAVLLDTAGRYQNDGPARDEWVAFVDTLKKYRGRRPIDSFVLTVNAEKILQAPDSEIEQQAKTLRARLDELIQRVGIKFPVYLMFSHIDAVEGFKEFFSASNASWRSEVWGATIPLDKALSAHALFDAEFDQLSESLARRRLIKLAGLRPPVRQLKIFSFPQRFAEARTKLGLFTSSLFRPNPFSESPLLRGFYFTANIRARDGAATARGSQNGDEEERPALAVGDSYFAPRFFKEVLLADQDVAASFQAAKQRPPILRYVLFGVGALFLFLLVAGMVVSFVGNKFLIANALERGARVDEISRADLGKDLTKKDPAAARVEVEAVDALRDTLVQLDEYDRKSPPLSLRFGLYSGNGINSSLRNIYFDSISHRYFNPTVGLLESDLRAFASGATVAPVSTNPADATASTADDFLGRNYDLLKAYLMLADPARVEPTFLANQLDEYWKKSSPPEMEIVSQQQLDFYSKQASSPDAPHIKVDDRLVSEVRRKLVAYPPVNRFYKRVVTEINAKTTPINLDSVLEGSGRGVLVGTHTVPGSFTVDGYRQYMRPAIESAAEEISKDDWVMGGASSSTQAQSTDISKLQGMYLREYTDQWRKFIRGISIREFKGKDDSVEALKALSSTDSPMERVMMAAARNTKISAKPESTGIWGWIKSWFTRGTNDELGGDTEVEKEFRPLFQFVSSGAAKKDSSPMSQYRAELRRVLDPLEGASADQLAQTSKSLLTGKDELGLQRADQAISNLLDGFKTAAAEEVKSLLKQPLGNLRAMLYGGGYEQIETAWRGQVYPRAHAIEIGYPFTDSGESSVTDLGRFLNPSNGQFSTFYNERLATSFDDVNGQWKLKEAGAFRFSDNFVTYLNNARKLREALFASGGQQPEVSYEVTLQSVPNTDIAIEIDGTRLETRGTSPGSAKFSWPARSGSSGGKITVAAAGSEPVELPFPGAWGLFKMFEAGAATKTPDNQFALTWNVGGVAVKATLRPASVNSPFQRSLFTNLHAPLNVRN